MVVVLVVGEQGTGPQIPSVTLAEPVPVKPELDCTVLASSIRNAPPPVTATSNPMVVSAVWLEPAVHRALNCSPISPPMCTGVTVTPAAVGAVAPPLAELTKVKSLNVLSPMLHPADPKAS